jgi:putative FmdB family regulatory protein
MPIHDFRCLDCGGVSEVYIRDSDLTPICPDCGGANLDRLISSSYMIKMSSQPPGTTCCGRSERCEAPACSTGDTCRQQ